MARQPAARRRRHRRFTPRRWLPFVALVAVVVGAVMVSSEETSAPTPATDPTADVSRLPAVSAADAISTAWYCSGGTAQAEGGLANLSILLANDADEGATAEITAYDGAGKSESTELDVPANGRARLALAELIEAEWVGALVEVRGGRVAVDREVDGPLGFDAGPCTTQASERWYVPSGSTLRGAEEYLSLFNPFPDTASVNLTFATNSGPRTPRALRALSIPGGSVRVVKLSETITDRSAIATTITARSGRVIVDRIQTYDGTGDPLGVAVEGETEVDPTAAPAPEGLISTVAIPITAPRWVFTGARVSPGIRTQFAIYNPSREAAEIEVRLTYEAPDRNPAIETVGLTVRPREQAIVDLADVLGLLPDMDIWVDIRSIDGAPVVAERLSWFNEPASRLGATATVGSPLAATDWLVTQGGPTRQRSTTVQVLNPGDTPAEITVSVLSGGDRSDLAAAAVTIPPGDRRSLVVADAGAAATIIISGTKPVVVTSSLSFADELGISIQPAFPYPESVVALSPVG